MHVSAGKTPDRALSDILNMRHVFNSAAAECFEYYMIGVIIFDFPDNCISLWCGMAIMEENSVFTEEPEKTFSS